MRVISFFSCNNLIFCYNKQPMGGLMENKKDDEQRLKVGEVVFIIDQEKKKCAESLVSGKVKQCIYYHSYICSSKYFIKLSER